MNFKTQIARLLRQKQTKAEKKLWKLLRNRKFEGLKFRRQHPLRSYIVDFFCEEYGIVVELDGSYHNSPEQKEKDRLRDLLLSNLSYKVIRFENKLVFNDIEAVFSEIKQASKEQTTYRENRSASLIRRQEDRKANENPLAPALSPRIGSKRILSTKILNEPQKELLLNAGIAFVEYDAISINFNNVEKADYYENIIISSKNAMIGLAKNNILPTLNSKNWFCVGEKTKSVLEDNSMKISEIGLNSLDLAQKIIKNHQNKKFTFFCGNKRRDELPDTLREHKIDFDEVEVYKTIPSTKKIKGHFDGILFFSPSAVESFMAENKIENSIAFCIGETTASEAEKHTKNIIIASKPTIENVVVQAIKHLSYPNKLPISGQGRESVD